MSNIRYMYLRDHNKNPIGCLAIKVNQPGNRPRFAEYQVSVVNPVDRVHPHTGKSVPFNRNMARDLALGRLMSQGLFVNINNDWNINQITRAVMVDLSTLSNPSHRGDIPTRAIKAAKLWLKNHSTT